MEIKIKEISIQNFKGCKERKIEFGDVTKISGANATGKTTVFDAFIWLMLGKDSLGSTKFDVRPLDERGKMIDNIEISVEAVLSVDGEEYALKKVQKQKWVKKRGTNTTEFQGNINEFEVNGYPKSEKEFKSFISEIVEEKVFNLVTNPMAFASLPWKEQREMLMKFVGDFTDTQIAEECGEKFSKLIPELKLASTEEILKKYNKIKSTLNKEMIEIPARIDEVSKQLVTVDVGVLEVEKSAKVVALKKVEDELVGGTAKFEEINKKREKIMDLQFSSGALCQMEEAKLSSKRSEARKAVEKAENETSAIKKQISDIAFEIESEKRNMENAESEKNRYAVEWRREKTSAFPPYVPLDEYIPPTPLSESYLICPTCGQDLPEEVKKHRISEYEKCCEKTKADYEAIVQEHERQYQKDKAFFETERSKKLQDITEKGQKASDDVKRYKIQIEEKEKLLCESKAELEVSLKKLEEERKFLGDIPMIPDMSSDAKYAEIQKQIGKLESEISEMSSDISGRTELETKKAVLCDEISDIEWKIKSADNSKVRERIAELEKEKAEVGQKIAEQEQMIDLTEEFIRTKMNRISSVINEKFKVVSFRLFETQINGGLKECCECMVNGVPYSSLNAGHRIVSGLDIISSISKLNKVSCPIFVDNAESINEFNIPDMESQMILLEVTDDKELKVEV